MANNKKQLWLKLILTLAAPILLFGIIFIAAGHADSPEDDLDTLINLSRTTALNRSSGAPVMRAISGTLVAIWSDGISEEQNDFNLNSGSSGHIFLQSATEAGGYWRPRISAHTAITKTLKELAADPDFVFSMVATQPYTLHLVWAEGDYTGGGMGNLKYPKIEYMQCQVANDFNSCWTESINIATSSSVNYRNPTIAQDDRGNLHVIWVNADTKELYYSRSYTHTHAITWTTPSLIANAANAANPDLIFANNRLHLVWDNENASSASNRCIKYRYDDTPTDNAFTFVGSKNWCADRAYFAIGGDNQYKNGNPGNPQLAAVPNLDSIFITFDMQGSGEENARTTDEFGLFYARSENNGDGWQVIPAEILDIPRQGERSQGFSIYHSDEAATTRGLMPTLALSYTAPITWGNVWLHALWHDNITAGEDATFQVMSSRRVVSNTAAGLAQQWTTPYTVSNPPVTPTPPPGRAPASPDAPAGESRDSVAAALAITNDGQKRMHAAFLEREKGEDTRWDVYYRGVIIGTIDPGYLQDPNVFQMNKTVEPGNIVTAANTIPSFPITYHISLNNSGTMNALGLALSDTLPSEIQSITGVEMRGGGTLVTDTVRKTISWTGTISRGEYIDIYIYGLTKDDLPVPTTIKNTVTLKNPGSKGEVALSKTAYTRITHYQIYLPVVMKQ